jgi:voltage-gated potassium channel
VNTWLGRSLIGGIREALRDVHPNWVATLITILGVSNIVSSILILPSRGLFLQILTQGIVQASGFSELIVGWILTLIGYGLYKRYRVAWQAAIVVLTASIVLNIFQTNLIGIGFSAIMLMFVTVGDQRYRKRLPHALDIRYIVIFWALAFVIIYGTFGAIFYGEEFSPPIDNYIKALYFTVATITTVGYGDITPASDEARLFAASLILVGVAIFLSVSVFIAQSFISRVEQISERARRLGAQEDEDKE